VEKTRFIIRENEIDKQLWTVSSQDQSLTTALLSYCSGSHHCVPFRPNVLCICMLSAVTAETPLSKLCWAITNENTIRLKLLDYLAPLVMCADYTNDTMFMNWEGHGRIRVLLLRYPFVWKGSNTYNRTSGHHHCTCVGEDACFIDLTFCTGPLCNNLLKREPCNREAVNSGTNF
jgi:hypothetical protein